MVVQMAVVVFEKTLVGGPTHTAVPLCVMRDARERDYLRHASRRSCCKNFSEPIRFENAATSLVT